MAMLAFAGVVCSNEIAADFRVLGDECGYRVAIGDRGRRGDLGGI
jgi:hypothetical protein